VVDKLFGIRTRLTLKSDEAAEEFTVRGRRARRPSNVVTTNCCLGYAHDRLDAFNRVAGQSTAPAAPNRASCAS
jgi:hypothetical protein